MQGNNEKDGNGLPVFKIDPKTGQAEELGPLTAELLYESFLNYNTTVIYSALIELRENGLITKDQEIKLTQDIQRSEHFFVSGSQHSIGLNALLDRVLTVADVLTMPSLTHVAYLTAVQEKARDFHGNRFWDGMVINLIRHKKITIEQFAQLPEQHVIDAFRRDLPSEGYYALLQGRIAAEELLQLSAKALNSEEDRALHHLILKQCYPEHYKDQNNSPSM